MTKLHKLALMCAASAVALTAASQAQAQAQSQSNAAANTETVVVTGSRVIANGNDSPTPLTVINTAEVPSNGACDLPTIVLTREGGTVLPPPGRWVLDPEHSIVRATTRHLGLSRVEGRFRAFSGAARAANSAGDHQKASEYFGKLVDLAKNADTERQEIREAKAYSRRDDTIGGARK